MARTSQKDRDDTTAGGANAVIGRAAPASSPSHGRPVDLVHLSHQTMGDAALEREVLGLLARQIVSFRDRLRLANGEERRRIAHALKGASLNVGAFRLSAAAQALERQPDDEPALSAFEAEMAIAGAFVADLLGGPATPR